VSKANSPVLRGLPPDAEAFDTITTHDWGDVGEWPAENDSSFYIVPAPGKAMALSGVLVRFSESMAMVAGNAMHIEGILADGIPAIPLATFARVRDYIKRSDASNRIAYAASGGDITLPVVELKLDFSAHVFLWSSAGMTPTGPRKDKLGIPKFGKLLVRMGANLPLRDKAGGALEIAASRYFAAIYADPDYVP
jgi:hypothetical protein